MRSWPAMAMLLALAAGAANAQTPASKWGGPDPSQAPAWRPEPKIEAKGGARTIATTPLAFEGLVGAGAAKTVNVAPLAFEGLHAGTRQISVAPLAFEGLHAGVRTINTSALLFEGQGATPKGGRK